MINDKGEEVGIIYGWYCTVTYKWYIGQTIDPEGRFKSHIKYSKKINSNFYNAIRKYGLNNFVYCVLEDNIIRENLNMKEIDWIEYYDSFYDGYNMTIGGGQNTKFSHISIKKMSDSHKGIKNCNYGKHRPEETRKKISNANKSHVVTEETRNKISESCKGHIAPNIRKVSKYDLNGNYIQTYNSIKDAKENNYKCSNIIAVCRGYRKQSGGFIWKYAS